LKKNNDTEIDKKRDKQNNGKVGKINTILIKIIPFSFCAFKDDLQRWNFEKKETYLEKNVII
jgi:hypothetical protein